mgnify:CR=1 FL=1
MDVEKMIRRLAIESGRSEEEVRRLFEKTLEEYKETLNEEGVLFLVARELGLSPAYETPTGEAILKLTMLIPGLKNVTTAGKVVRVIPATTFTRKNGSTGRRAELLIADETARRRVVLWGRAADLASEGIISVGDVIKIRGARVRRGLDGTPEIHVDHSSIVEPLSEDELKADLASLKDIRPDENFYPLSDLEEGMVDVDTQAVILSIFPPREFTRPDGRTGRVGWAIVGDAGETVRAVFWDSSTRFLEGLSPGDVVKLLGVKVKQAIDGGKELHLGSRSSIVVIGREEGVAAAQISRDYKIADLTPGLIGVNLTCRLIHAFSTRTFRRSDGSLSYVGDMIVEDDTGMIRVVVWGENAKKIQLVPPSSTIRIVNAYTREDSRGVYLQLGDSSSIELISEELSPIPQSILEKAIQLKYPMRMISQLAEGFYQIRGTIIKASDSVSIIHLCTNCGQKLTLEYGKLRCQICGLREDSDILLVLPIVIDDGTGRARVLLYREQVERLIGLSKSEILSKLEEYGLPPDAFPVELSGRQLLGREVVIRGLVKQDIESGEIIVRCDEIEEADVREECMKIISELSQL